MASIFVRFRCPACNATIRSPIMLSGQRRKCPGCNSALVVPQAIPPDSEPLLAPLEYGGPFTMPGRQPHDR
jgi:hypothetical protein